MAVETELERPAGWYVSRIVNLPRSGTEAWGLLGGIVTPTGASLRIGGLVQRERSFEDYQSYAATLDFPGLLATKIKVELVVTRYSGGLAEVGLRPVSRIPQRRVGAERYFEAAWAVLEAITRVTSASTQDLAAEGPVTRITRRFARAS